MIRVWMSLMVGILVMGVGIGMVMLPISGEVRCRKTWSGSLRGCWQLKALGIPLTHGRLRWHSFGRMGQPSWSQGWRLLRWLLRFGRLHHWHLSAEIGFRDPAVTGQWIGLISALPPVVGRCIHLTFTRTGWQLRGRLQGSVALGWLLGLGIGVGIRLGWTWLRGCLRAWRGGGTVLP